MGAPFAVLVVADAYAQRVELYADGLALAVDGLDDGRSKSALLLVAGVAAAVVMVLDIVFIVFWVNV